jgi:hypothetical protein
VQKNEKRELTADENVQADRIIADEEELRKKLSALEKLEDMKKSLKAMKTVLKLMKWKKTTKA